MRYKGQRLLMTDPRVSEAKAKWVERLELLENRLIRAVDNMERARAHMPDQPIYEERDGVWHVKTRADYSPEFGMMVHIEALKEHLEARMTIDPRVSEYYATVAEKMGEEKANQLLEGQREQVERLTQEKTRMATRIRTQEEEIESLRRMVEEVDMEVAHHRALKMGRWTYLYNVAGPRWRPWQKRRW